MKSLYFFPSCPKEGYVNPYCNNYKKSLSKYFNVAELDNPKTPMKSLTLLLFSFKADVFVLNWIENAFVWKLGFLQFFLVVLSLFIIKLRNKKIVWMYHNISPHEGKSFCSEFIMKFLFKNASIIISHSKLAEKIACNFARCPVRYLCHPVCIPVVNECKHKLADCEIIVWGSILPYKGIAEFLENAAPKISKNILIIGKCSDSRLEQRIKKSIRSNITFVNRYAPYEEIAAYVKKAEYVLFPYNKDSVSSSGALMDTIAMGGGIPIGPNTGAFCDLAEEGVCLTYESYEELISILNTPPPHKDMNDFIEKNTWENFAMQFNKLLI